MPKDKCLELKSLKEYLFVYRNLGIFQENIVNQVLDDVVKATDPVWCEINGDFRPRGWIFTVVTARYPRSEEFTRQSSSALTIVPWWNRITQPAGVLCQIVERRVRRSDCRSE
jgi:NADPH-dependent 7-cyano-7-deazaguanine reductase QueF